MADHGVNLYGNVILVNSKFASEKPEAVKKFLAAFMKGVQYTVQSPQTAIDSVIKRNDVAKKNIELDRLNMALRDNFITPDVKEKGFGLIDPARFEKSVDQIALTYDFKNAKPKVTDVFDSSFLPPASELRM